MRKQRGIWIPSQDIWDGWNKNFEIREYNKLKLKGNLAIDIGTHVGIWSQRLSKTFEQVICFEPLPKHIECHKKNCENLDNIVLYECALSNTFSKSVMTTKDNNSGMSTLLDASTLASKQWKNKSEQSVLTKTLDSYNFPRMDFIKIDVEGWEEQVLAGSKETIKEYHPKIYIEIWKKNYPSISSILGEMGYSLEKFSSHNYLCKATL